ncbi:hypothetical protein [Hungatella sp.]
MEERAVIGVLSKEEIDRIADEILAGLKEGKEEKSLRINLKRNSGTLRCR